MSDAGSLDTSGWTLPRALDRRVLESADRPFVTMEHEGTESYAEARAAARTMAAALRAAGVRPGQRVAVMAPNSLTAIHAWLGANLIGAADVMLNTAYRGRTLEHALNLVGCEVLLAEERFLPVLRESEAQLTQLRRIVHFRLPDTPSAALPRFARHGLVALEALMPAAGDVTEPAPAPAFNDLASIIFTSGTSGPAKGVMMPHAQAYALALQTAQGLRLRTHDVYYCFHPLFHTAGKFISLYAGILSGAHVILDRSFRAERWLERIREHGATVTLAHGAMLEMVHALPPSPADRLHKLERLLASPFPRRIAADFEERFGVRGIEVWGMTEVNNPCWCPYDGPPRRGTCGRPDPAWAEMRVVDPATDVELAAGQIGEFVVRPRHPWTMMQGYYGMPEKTVEAWRNLWFHTGDAGYVDAEGWFHFVDRLGDRIRRRAENISSYEIESAALDDPAVRECAAVGIPSCYEADDDIKLFVVAQPDAPFDPAALLERLVRLLPHYMVPRYVETIAALPRTPTNKVRKAELRSAPAGSSCWDRKAAGVSVRAIAERAVRRVQ
jgi:crotonobetaine/carnitine-CoA ligase